MPSSNAPGGKLSTIVAGRLQVTEPFGMLYFDCSLRVTATLPLPAGSGCTPRAVRLPPRRGSVRSFSANVIYEAPKKLCSCLRLHAYLTGTHPHDEGSISQCRDGEPLMKKMTTLGCLAGLAVIGTPGVAQACWDGHSRAYGYAYAPRTYGYVSYGYRPYHDRYYYSSSRYRPYYSYGYAPYYYGYGPGISFSYYDIDRRGRRFRDRDRGDRRDRADVRGRVERISDRGDGRRDGMDRGPGRGGDRIGGGPRASGGPGLGGSGPRGGGGPGGGGGGDRGR
jgi:hypothetical protein